MLYVAFTLAAASALFYHASGRDAGAWARPLCTYGDVFCQHPTWLFYIAALCFLWGLFLKVDRI